MCHYSLYCIFTSFCDVICDKESKEACKNRMREYFIENYNEDFVNVYLTERVAVRKLIVIFSKQDALTHVCANTHEQLKKDDSSIASHFHPYDINVIRTAQQVRSIIVT